MTKRMDLIYMLVKRGVRKKNTAPYTSTLDCYIPKNAYCTLSKLPDVRLKVRLKVHLINLNQ